MNIEIDNIPRINHSGVFFTCFKLFLCGGRLLEFC